MTLLCVGLGNRYIKKACNVDMPWPKLMQALQIEISLPQATAADSGKLLLRITKTFQVQCLWSWQEVLQRGRDSGEQLEILCWVSRASGPFHSSLRPPRL